MASEIRERMSDTKEIRIICGFAETHGWDHDDCNLAEFLIEYYEDYEEYREWYLMMVA